MLTFIAEALTMYAECHATQHQTTSAGEGLRVQVDLGDGEGLRWFYITATECR
jgi:hypothetical protein